MAVSVLKICRICLEQLDENELSHFLNNDNDLMLLSKLIDFLPEIDMNFVQNPISCNQCTITINQMHELKNLCVQTESVLKELKQQRKSFNEVISYVKNETETIMIKEEILEEEFKDEYTINVAESVSKICRICLVCLGKNEHFYFLNNDNGSLLLSKLLDIMPEMDFDFVQNPICCNQCTIIIDQIHRFKKLCLQTESVIKDLKMQQKSFEDFISYVKNDVKIVSIKEELLEDKFNDEPLIVDNNCLQVNTDLPVCIEVPTELLFYCYTCNYTTCDKKNLAQHITIHRLQVNQFKCNQCSYITLNNSYLTTHKQSHHNTRPYQCNICDNSYVQKDHLKVHLRLHTREKVYKCDVCDYRSNYQSRLTMHIRTHTGEKPYKCDICEYRSSRKSYLKMHLKLHTREKPYKCDFCDYSCVRKNTLKMHLRTHIKEKPHKCNVCEFSCTYKSGLIRHIRTHTGEKPYKCDVCGNSYGLKEHLKLHLKSHTGEKPYKCDVCNYSCIQKITLQLHLRTHTGEKPYKCDVCDYSSVRKSTLKLHLISHTRKKNV